MLLTDIKTMQQYKMFGIYKKLLNCLHYYQIKAKRIPNIVFLNPFHHWFKAGLLLVSYALLSTWIL
jgi:hypothetical protein